MEHVDHILIVDDDREIRELVGNYLKKNGLRTTVVADGRQMRSFLEANQVDLIVLDLGLPDRDGLELIGELRQLSAAPILVAHVTAGYFQFSVVDWPSFWGAFWLQGLIAGVAALAGVCQLAFMIALVQQAVRDPLTGAFSRRSGEEVLELQFILASRSGSPFSVAFIDIDHFKAINDQFGHQQGDVMLKQFAQTLTQGLRKGDVVLAASSGVASATVMKAQVKANSVARWWIWPRPVRGVPPAGYCAAQRQARSEPMHGDRVAREWRSIR